METLFATCPYCELTYEYTRIYDAFGRPNLVLRWPHQTTHCRHYTATLPSVPTARFVKPPHDPVFVTLHSPPANADFTVIERSDFRELTRGKPLTLTIAGTITDITTGE